MSPKPEFRLTLPPEADKCSEKRADAGRHGNIKGVCVMRNYELMIVVVPEAGNDGVEDIRKEISDALEKEAGQLTSLSVWKERQKLAYTLRSRGAQKRKYNEATYLLAEYSLDTSKLGRLKYVLDLDERVLRYMNVNKGEANG